MSCDAHRAQIGGAFWGRLSGKCSPPKGGKSEENVQRYVRRNFQGGECAYGYWLTHRNRQTDEQTCRQLLTGYTISSVVISELK